MNRKPRELKRLCRCVRFLPHSNQESPCSVERKNGQTIPIFRIIDQYDVGTKRDIQPRHFRLLSNRLMRIPPWRGLIGSQLLPSCSLPVSRLQQLPPSISLQRRWFSDTAFVCSECGKEYSKWQGQCYSCHSWNTITAKTPTPTVRAGRSPYKGARPLKLDEITPSAHSRILLQGKEINRIFGGGVVPGSLVLIGGEPGIGKSTMLLRIASDICQSRGPVLYVSGEESEDQVKLRCDRLGISNSNLFLLHETNIDSIVQLVSQQVSVS